MAPNYQSILALMNLILIACAGFTIIGFYRVLKVFGLVPWEASAPREMTFPREKEVLLERSGNPTYRGCGDRNFSPPEAGKPFTY